MHLDMVIVFLQRNTEGLSSFISLGHQAEEGIVCSCTLVAPCLREKLRLTTHSHFSINLVRILDADTRQCPCVMASPLTSAYLQLKSHPAL
jgi:hypothetical protein